MKLWIAIVVLMSTTHALAGLTLHCRTEKTETDLSDKYFSATDSNQRIVIPLQEKTVLGKKLLTSVKSQLLKYEFSQSTGGKSVWSFEVTHASVHGDDIALNVILRNSGKPVLPTQLNLKVYDSEGPDSAVGILNQNLAINGKIIVYNPSETEATELLNKYLKLASQHKFKNTDLAWLVVANCQLKN